MGLDYSSIQFGFTKWLPLSASVDAFFGRHLVTRDLGLSTRPRLTTTTHQPDPLVNTPQQFSCLRQRPLNLDALRGRQKWPHCTPLNGPGHRPRHDGASLLPWPISLIFFVFPPILPLRSRVHPPSAYQGLFPSYSSFFILSAFPAFSTLGVSPRIPAARSSISALPAA